MSWLEIRIFIKGEREGKGSDGKKTRNFSENPQETKHWVGCKMITKEPPFLHSPFMTTCPDVHQKTVQTGSRNSARPVFIPVLFGL